MYVDTIIFNNDWHTHLQIIEINKKGARIVKYT